MELHPGGCSCGHVRYRVRNIQDAGYTHAPRARRAVGAPVVAWALVAAADLALGGAPPAEHAVDGGVHAFCPRCGTSLWLTEAGTDLLRVTLGSLEEPERVEPRVHTHVESQLTWLKLNDLLPVSEGGEPPPPAQRSYLRGPADASVTRDAPLTLREITSDNLMHVLLLDVAGGQQRFVAATSVSLAQAMFHTDCHFRAIYAAETPIGFVLFERLHEDYAGLPTRGAPFLWRFLIDHRYQRLGLGARSLTAALDELLAWLGTRPRAVWTSCVPGAGGPLGFYQRLGFRETGVETDGERILALDLAARTA